MDAITAYVAKTVCPSCARWTLQPHCDDPECPETWCSRAECSFDGGIPCWRLPGDRPPWLLERLDDNPEYPKQWYAGVTQFGKFFRNATFEGRWDRSQTWRFSATSTRPAWPDNQLRQLWETYTILEHRHPYEAEKLGPEMPSEYNRPHAYDWTLTVHGICIDGIPQGYEGLE